jgi:TonB family protein
VWLNNLFAYSLQIAILAAVGTLLAYLFRLRTPRVTLIYWQALLLASIFLPFMQRWKHPVFSRAISGSVNASSVVSNIALPANVRAPIHIPWEALALIIAAGIFLRLVWLVIGFFRLRLFHDKSSMFLEEHAAVRDMQWCTGVRVSLLLSGEIDSPVTFGLRPPTIILPLSFKNLSEPCQRAVLCHELLHVRRYDWILIVVEELVCSLFWFHPAIWWLRSRIHLSREQAVDYEVVQLTGSKQPYLDSLLEFARAQGRPRAVPAPLFLKERHLVQRVALLIKEVSMSRSRLAVSMLGITALLIMTVYLASGWFPLTGAPVPAQEKYTGTNAQAPLQETLASSPGQVVNSEVRIPRRPAMKVDGDTQEAKLISKVEPVYPEQAKREGLEGIVRLEVTINEEGSVFSILTLTFTDEILEEAAIAAVRQWKYSPTMLNGEPVPVKTLVTVMFGLRGINDLVAMMDESGNLNIGQEKLLRAKGRVRINIAPATPFRVAENAVRSLLHDGVQKIELSEPFVLYQGQLYFSGTPANVKDLSIGTDGNLLISLARATGQFNKGQPYRLCYRLYFNEAGDVVGLQQFGGARVPEIENELMRIHRPPALLGSDPVSYVSPFGFYFIG